MPKRISTNCDQHQFPYNTTVCTRCGYKKPLNHQIHEWAPMATDKRYEYCRVPDCTAQRKAGKPMERVGKERHVCGPWFDTSTPELEGCACGMTRLKVPD